MPLIEITVARDTLNEKQRLRLAEAVQKTLIKKVRLFVESHLDVLVSLIVYLPEIETVRNTIKTTHIL